MEIRGDPTRHNIAIVGNAVATPNHTQHQGTLSKRYLINSCLRSEYKG